MPTVTMVLVYLMSPPRLSSTSELVSTPPRHRTRFIYYSPSSQSRGASATYQPIAVCPPAVPQWLPLATVPQLLYPSLTTLPMDAFTITAWWTERRGWKETLSIEAFPSFLIAQVVLNWRECRQVLVGYEKGLPIVLRVCETRWLQLFRELAFVVDIVLKHLKLPTRYKPHAKV